MDRASLVTVVALFTPFTRYIHRMRKSFTFWIRPRLSTVPYFSVRLSRSSALPYRLPSCLSAPSVHLKIKMAAINGKTRYISRYISHGKIGDCEQSKSAQNDITNSVTLFSVSLSASPCFYSRRGVSETSSSTLRGLFCTSRRWHHNKVPRWVWEVPFNNGLWLPMGETKCNLWIRIRIR